MALFLSRLHVHLEVEQHGSQKQNSLNHGSLWWGRHDWTTSPASTMITNYAVVIETRKQNKPMASTSLTDINLLSVSYPAEKFLFNVINEPALARLKFTESTNSISCDVSTCWSHVRQMIFCVCVCVCVSGGRLYHFSLYHELFLKITTFGFLSNTLYSLQWLFLLQDYKISISLKVQKPSYVITSLIQLH